MSVIDWLKGAAHKVARGASAFGSRIIKPAADFLKKIPIVGDVVRSADPIGQLVQKTADYASDTLGGVEKGKRRAAPTFDDLKAGIQAVPETAKAISTFGTSAANLRKKIRAM